MRVEDRNERQPVSRRQAAQRPRGALLHRIVGHLADGVDRAGARSAHRQARHHPGPDGPHCHTKSFRERVEQRAEVIVPKPGGEVVARSIGKAGATLRLPVPNPHLWTPDDPFLYDLKVRLLSPVRQGRRRSFQLCGVAHDRRCQ